MFKTTQNNTHVLQNSNTFSLRIAKKYRGWKYNFEFWKSALSKTLGGKYALDSKIIWSSDDVMKYATFSSRIWRLFYKTCSFHSILQWNLTFSLLTWLGSPTFLPYLLVHTENYLWVVFNKIWMIRFFDVANYMVRKFSLCSTLYADVIANIILLHIFINLKIFFISWNMILK